MDMFLTDQGMIDIGLAIVIHPGGDRILEVEKDSDEIDRELQIGLQTFQSVLGASARLVSR